MQKRYEKNTKQTVVETTAAVFGACIIGLIGYFIHTNAFAITANQYTCQPNGSYASVTSGPAALTADDTSRSEEAMEWLHSMVGTRTIVTTASTITPTTEYDPTHTSQMTGSFVLNGASYPTKSDASIEITSPSVVPDNYAGVVQGKVTPTPQAFRWIIQVYKRTSGGDVQVAKQSLADAETGEFTIDLSDVSSPPAGAWAFGILDANAGYAEYGTKWPSPAYYDGLEVQHKLVTDSIYDWSTTKALADNTFVFPNSNNGKKLFRLVDTASGNVLAEHVESTGLIRSFQIDDPADPAYGTALQDQSYVYDQAVALFAAIGVNDQPLADALVEGLLHLQETTGPFAGGFVFAAPQLSPTYRDELIRTGAHAIATDALLEYIEKYPGSSNATQYRAAAVAGLAFIDDTLSTSGTTEGLYLGGYGDYSGPSGSFDGTVVIPWASTEHNIDIWNTFVKAERVLGDSSGYGEKAAALNSAIMSKLYSAPEQRLFQGMQASGVDTADPLDVNSWGAMQLYSAGQFDEALGALARVEPFKFTSNAVTGYAPFYDSPGYPGAVPTVWFEGSYGVALALYHVGNYDEYRALLTELANGQESDGSFRYATDEDAVYSITTRKSVASTAWFVLATTGRDAIWNECIYTPPTDPIEEPETPIVTQPTDPGTTTPPIPPKNTQGSGAGSGSSEPLTDTETEATDDTEKDDEGVPDPVEMQTSEDAAETSEEAFSWTPLIIAGSVIGGAGILWGVIAFVRSRFTA